MPEAPPTTKGRVITPVPLAWHRRLLASFIYLTIRAVAATLRPTLKDDSGLFQNGKDPQVIFAIWHNRLALCMLIYRWFVEPRGKRRKLAAIVSASRDGGVVARILEHFNVQPVRGSSSRRGAQALLELTGWAEQGHNIAITPDGPRGPCYVVQHGVIGLAHITGLPIVPVSYELSWKIRLKSWDRFQIPLPFARWSVRFGAPIVVPRSASEGEREALRLQLESALKAITEV